VTDREVSVEQLEVPGPVVPVPIRIYRAAQPNGVGLVWMHGGGFGIGDLDLPEADATARFLAARGFTVVSSHYRLAVGGVHFPAPVDDVRAAWTWAVESSGLPVDGGRWHIGGGSAGATLAAAVALQAVHGLAPRPASVVLAYPGMHGVWPEASAEVKAAMARATRVIEPEIGRKIALDYVGDDALLTHPYAFPGHADDVRGFPPTLVQVCELDGLRPSGEAFAKQLIDAGVDIEYVFERDTEHAHLNEPDSEAARHTLNRIAAWLRRDGHER
jgi:acetyl esterase/lipase